MKKKDSFIYWAVDIRSIKYRLVEDAWFGYDDDDDGDDDDD